MVDFINFFHQPDDQQQANLNEFKTLSYTDKVKSLKSSNMAEANMILSLTQDPDMKKILNELFPTTYPAQ